MNLKENAELLASVTNQFASKHIWQKDDIRFLTTDGIAIQSAIYLETPAALPLSFNHYFLFGIFFLEQFDSALVLGLGGGCIPRYLNHHGVKGTAIDIDPQMPDIAKKWFQAPTDESWNFIVADVRDFLKTNTQVFDYVIFDICIFDQSPDWLAHVGILQQLKAACSKDGVVVINYLLTDVAKFYVLFQNVRQVFDGQVGFMSIDNYVNIVIVAFPSKFSSQKLGLQESKINSLIARWRLDFEHMLIRMKKDTPSGSGIFG